MSGGHAALSPVQDSATSQTPAEARHCVVLFASAGHCVFTPLQVSVMSHAPAEARQTNPFGRFVSVGQLSPSPVHVSATSHGPADARHCAVLFVSAGQVALV